jgi:hypothetical protein
VPTDHPHELLHRVIGIGATVAVVVIVNASTFASDRLSCSQPPD